MTMIAPSQTAVPVIPVTTAATAAGRPRDQQSLAVNGGMIHKIGSARRSCSA